MVTTCRDLYSGSVSSEIDEAAGRVIVSIAEFSVRVVPPAFDLAAVKACTCMCTSGGDGGDSTGREVNECAGCVGVGVVAVAELSVRVVSPAPHFS